jgi:ubiquinone/menaquinone biosynthesis C-methylase UbiE
MTRTPQPFPASKAWVLDNPLMRAMAGGIVRRLGIRPGMRVVDVGCGPGRLTLPVARAVGDEGEVLAVDMQRRMLDIVERRAAAVGLRNVRASESAAGGGALPAGRYDLALLCFVLGEIPSDRRRTAIHEIAEALRPGGMLAVAEGIFDPHRQRRDAVIALTRPEGLRLERQDRTLTTTLLLFQKPPETWRRPAHF